MSSVTSQPDSTKEREAAQKKAEADEAKKRADRVNAHRDKVAGAPKTAKSPGDQRQAKIEREAALLAEAFKAKAEAQYAAEGMRLALLANSTTSEWDRNHYSKYVAEILAERAAVIASKGDDAPSVADAAGATLPFPGVTPGSPRLFV